MSIHNNNEVPNNRRKITVVAECMSGALDAGRFAVRNLLDDDAEILLLQVYQKPAFGHEQLSNLSSMLTNIAKEELNEIKSRLIDEYQISPDLITIQVYEENLSSLLKLEIFNTSKHSFVIGLDSTSSKRNVSYRRTINSLVDSGIRPLIIVSDEITLIEKENIVHFSGESPKSNPEFLNFLDTIKEKKKLNLRHPVMHNYGMPFLSPETTQHFRAINGKVYHGLSESENLLRQEIKFKKLKN